MPIDASIPLSVNQPKFDDPLTMASKAYTLKSAMANADLAPLQAEKARLGIQSEQMQVQQQRQQMQDQQTLQQIMQSPDVRGAGGQIDPQKVLQNATGKISYDTQYKLQDMLSKHQEQQAKIHHEAIESAGPFSMAINDAMQQTTKQMGGDKQAALKSIAPQYAEIYKQIATDNPSLKLNPDINSLKPEQVEQFAQQYSKYSEHMHQKKSEEVSPFAKELIAAGYKQGTPEFNAQMQKRISRETSPTQTMVNISQGGNAVSEKDSNKTGDEYLNTLPKSQQNLIKSIADGRIKPESLSTKGGHREKILAQVTQYKPDYDQKSYGQQDKAIKDFNTGKQGQSVRSFNVALEHLDTLGDLSNALSNGNLQMLNKAKNSWKTATGSEAPTDFNGAKQIVTAEVLKAIVATGGGVSEREEASKNISSASSPEQLNGQIKTYKKLFGGQLKGLENQYKSSTGKDNFRDRYLTDKGKEAAKESDSGSERKVNPKTGKPYTAADFIQ